MNGYPRWFRSGLLAVLAMALCSGLLLTPTMLVMRAELEMPWQLDSGWRTGVAAWHAAVSLGAVWMVGALWSVHMRAGWRRRQRRGSGLLTAAAALVLAVTALCVYYMGDEVWAFWAAGAHVAVGVLAILPLVWHMWARRGTRRRRHRWR